MFYVWKFKRNQNICQGLSKEYLEIDIEMSYVMFSAACPPALLVGILIISPFKILRRKKLWILNLLEKKIIFLALGKNLVETRFDAKKLLLQHRFYSTLFKRLSMCFSIWQMIHNSFILYTSILPNHAVSVMFCIREFFNFTKRYLENTMNSVSVDKTGLAVCLPTERPISY